MINKLFAVCLLVDNLEQSIDFYTNKLGLEFNSQDTGFADFKLGETPLAIFERKHATSMFSAEYMSQSGDTVIALSVQDVSATCLELTKKGIKVFEGPKQTAWGQTVAYIHDPDGHIIELTS